MLATTPLIRAEDDASTAARQRLLSKRGDPLFYSDWSRAVFIHFEVDPEKLQPFVPFPLDLRDGKAYVSLVAFTMEGLRPCWGGRFTAWSMAPIATHELLNVRTYVRHGDETGIYFIAEWIPNRLSAWLGPRTFGLPYRHGRLGYNHHHELGILDGTVAAGQNQFAYEAGLDPEPDFRVCGVGSLDAFLMERYTAFTTCRGQNRFFRIWHPPWLQTKINVRISDDSLLKANFPWFPDAKYVGANYTPGVKQVWMGRPHKLGL
jgi:uncharacterized protein YqjF (DUF2071 family)